MNVANLNNCKELYELSGWEPEQYYITRGDDEYYAVAGLGQKPHEDHNPIPAYDSGYLLRKLPYWVELKGNGVDIWYIQSKKPRGEYLPQLEANTPEDALTLLAIQLFKDGILQKESTEL